MFLCGVMRGLGTCTSVRAGRDRTWGLEVCVLLWLPAFLVLRLVWIRLGGNPSSAPVLLVNLVFSAVHWGPVAGRCCRREFLPCRAGRQRGAQLCQAWPPPSQARRFIRRSPW